MECFLKIEKLEYDDLTRCFYHSMFVDRNYFFLILTRP